jgi:hypothetical protein
VLRWSKFAMKKRGLTNDFAGRVRLDELYWRALYMPPIQNVRAKKHRHSTAAGV